MKKFMITSILVALFATGTTLMAQDKQDNYLGLPGDNLNLYAVMKLFQESKTLEDFERSLNNEQSTINNLDLNGDNLVDYIKVIDNVDGNVHNIVLQDAISPVQNQDVAVFTVQRFQNGQVQIQLTGDEALYGKNYIIEPIFDDANSGGTPNPGYTGNTRTVDGQTVTYIRTTPAQIAAWPLVRIIFLPSYVIYQSSWRWGYYPNYWHTWRPFSWNYYYGYQYNWNRDYFEHYRSTNYHRYTRWNDDYFASKRSYSPDVNHRIQTGSYKTTYSHPDQRKDGEQMFAKTHPDEYRKSTAVSSVNTTTRRSTNTMNNPNRPANDNSNINRRTTTTTITNKSVTNPSNGNNAVTTRKSTNTMTNRPNNNSSTGNNTVMTRRTTPVTNPSSEKSTVTTRKSTTTVTNRSVTNPSSGQNAAISNTTNQSKKNVVSSSSRRNVKQTKSETTIKKDDKNKEPENKDSNNRR
jgi:hypothetical protein